MSWSRSRASRGIPSTARPTSPSPRTWRARRGRTGPRPSATPTTMSSASPGARERCGLFRSSARGPSYASGMIFPEYEQYDALGLAELVKWGKISPPELLEAAIERVEGRNPTVNAGVMKLYDYGRKAKPEGPPRG